MQSFQLPASLIERAHYLRKIQPFIGKGLIKVVTGQRRVGKSYLLYQLIRHIRQQSPEANILYINKEDLAFDHLRSARDLHDYVTAHAQPDTLNYVFVDEIQEIAGFEKALRSLLLLPHLDLYCTGSNAQLLSGELATLLSGRCLETTVYSLAYPEFLQFHALTDSDEALGHYLRFGGLPYLVNLPLQEEIVGEYLKNIHHTILFRDVVDRHRLRNTHLLERLVLFLADNVGSLFSAKKISDFLKAQHLTVSPHQIQVLTAHLADAFLVHRVPRYDLVGKRLFEFGEKFYFENLGIRHALWGYRPQDLGKILENAVFNHLLFQGYQVRTGSLDDREIDFICEKDGEKQYVQVALRIASDETHQREFGNLLRIPDQYPKKVVSFDSFHGNTFEGIPHLPLRQFLMGD